MVTPLFRVVYYLEIHSYWIIYRNRNKLYDLLQHRKTEKWFALHFELLSDICIVISCNTWILQIHLHWYWWGVISLPITISCRLQDINRVGTLQMWSVIWSTIYRHYAILKSMLYRNLQLEYSSHMLPSKFSSRLNKNMGSNACWSKHPSALKQLKEKNFLNRFTLLFWKQFSTKHFFLS